MLMNAGIYPKNNGTYDSRRVSDVLEKRIGAKPVITCFEENGVQHLWEVWICYDKQFRLIDCVHKVPNCGNIIFPISV